MLMGGFMLAKFFLGLIFSQSVQASNNFIYEESIRKNCRREVIEKSFLNSDKSIILQNDRAQNLVEDKEKMIFSLADMESLKLLKKEVSSIPWSDTYWPLYEGGLGHRYNDPQMHFGNWKDSHNYVMKETASKLIKKKKFDFLSPSEKYDYLLDLKDVNLTNISWADGEAYFIEYGKVETWMGLCHGWAAASMMMTNPEKRVEINKDGNKMTFYPSDIKGLGTMLWANGQFETRFIGGRCNSKNPSIDEMGRSVEADCLDNNPGTWHLAIVNQIGIFDRSFVMDASSDYQVWNQPVYGYEYVYFNPKTNIESQNLSEAIVKINDWDTDVKKAVRAPQTKSIVGIKMRVTYISENSPTLAEFQEVNFVKTEYIYDLELDEKNNIIGGEWSSDNHPDFLWVAKKDAFPSTIGDNLGLEIDLNNISSDVKKAAAANLKYKLPFGSFVRELFKGSSFQNNR